MMYWIISLIDVFIILYFVCFTYIREKRSKEEFKRYKFPLIAILATVGLSFMPVGQWILLPLLLIVVPITIYFYNDSYYEDYEIKIKGFLFNRI